MSCTDRDDEISTVNIRILNNSKFSFTELRIVEKDTTYENIAAGDYSEYYAFESASEEMELSILTDSTTYSYMPSVLAIDSLPVGFYTYALDIDPENEVLFNFRVD